MLHIKYFLLTLCLLSSFNIYADDTLNIQKASNDSIISDKSVSSGANISNKDLSNVEITYRETYPNVYGNGVFIGMFQVMRRSFGATNLEIKELSEQDKIADSLLVKSGYTDIPVSLLTALVNDFKVNHIESSTFFKSDLRSAEIAEPVTSALRKLPAISKENINYSLIVMPFRDSYVSDTKSTLHIAVLLYNMKEKKWEGFKWYITLDLDSAYPYFNEASGKKVSASIIGALKKENWIH